MNARDRLRWLYKVQHDPNVSVDALALAAGIATKASMYEDEDGPMCSLRATVEFIRSGCRLPTERFEEAARLLCIRGWIERERLGDKSRGERDLVPVIRFELPHWLEWIRERSELSSAARLLCTVIGAEAVSVQSGDYPQYDCHYSSMARLVTLTGYSRERVFDLLKEASDAGWITFEYKPEQDQFPLHINFRYPARAERAELEAVDELGGWTTAQK